MPRKEKVGVVVSDKMDKTRVVEIIEKVTHPKYKKILTRSTRFKAHDEENTTKVGDTVRIVESRPMSRNKRWTLQEVIQQSEEV